MAKVSVIVPVYNAANYLRECLTSLQKQTFSEWECICVDDGSTDNSKEILDSFAKSDCRFTCVTQENQGPSVARNLGLKLAGGKYVSFVDSDDYLAPDYLWNLVYKAEESNADVCCCGYVCLESVRTYTHHDYPVVDFPSKDYYLKHLYTATGGTAWGKLFKLDIIRKHDIRFNRNLKMCEDQLFALDYYVKSSNFASVESFGYFYCRQNINSLSLNTNVKIWLQQAELISYIERTLREARVSVDVRRYCLQKKTASVLSALFSKASLQDRGEVDALLKKPLVRELIRRVKITNLAELRFLLPLKLGWVSLIRLIYR